MPIQQLFTSIPILFSIPLLRVHYDMDPFFCGACHKPGDTVSMVLFSGVLNKVHTMAEFVDSFEGYILRAIDDEDAPGTAETFVKALNSDWLESLVLGTHELEGRSVLMKDHLNLVLILEKPAYTVLSFIFAELEADKNLARLHVLYTLRDLRRSGYASALLRGFDSLLQRAGYENVRLAATSLISKRMLDAHAAGSELDYSIVAPSRQALCDGDIEAENA